MFLKHFYQEGLAWINVADGYLAHIQYLSVSFLYGGEFKLLSQCVFTLLKTQETYFLIISNGTPSTIELLLRCILKIPLLPVEMNGKIVKNAL